MQLAQALSSHSIDAIWSSDLLRTVQTADYIAKTINVQVRKFQTLSSGTGCIQRMVEAVYVGCPCAHFQFAQQYEYPCLNL